MSITKLKTAVKGGASIVTKSNSVVHIIHVPIEGINRYGVSLCGQAPGKHGYGWVIIDRVVTCPRCKILKAKYNDNGSIR